MRAPSVLLACALWSGAALAALPLKPGATVEGITEYRAPNGLVVLLFPDPSKSTVTVNVTYLVGSRHEAYGETGMAHLLEHMLFKGTPKFPKVDALLSERGATFNATTDSDRTNYFETLPASDENLELALRFEADRMQNVPVRPEDLASEMTVVRNELEIGESEPLGVLLERTLSTAYLWHNYGKAVIGARSDIERVPAERLRALYKTYYQPDNAVLVVAGRFDAAKALKWIAETFARLPRPKRALPSTYTREPTQDGERQVVLRRTGGVQAVVAVYHVPSATDPDFPAVEVLAALLGEGTSSRLHQALVGNQLAAKVSQQAFSLREPGVAVFGAEVNTSGSLDKSRDALLAVVEGFSKKPPTDAEVERARNSLLKDIALTLDDSQSSAIELSEWAAIGDWRMMLVHRDRLKAVTAADVTRVAQRYFKPANRTLGLFVPTDKPDRAEVPEPTDVAQVVKEYKGEPERQQGEAFDAAPQAIEKRVVRFLLPSGLQVALLPKKTRGAQVSGQLTLRLGSESELTGRRAELDMAARMLLRGTTTRSRAQVEAELDRLHSELDAYAGANSVTVRLSTRGEDLDAVLALVAESLRKPAMDKKEFEALRAEVVAELDQNRSEPHAVAALALRRTLDPFPPEHPLYTPTFDEALALAKKASLDRVRELHAKLFGASAGELVLVGDFDVPKLRSRLTELLGDWKSATPYQRIPRQVTQVPGGASSLLTPDKATAVLMAGFSLALRDDDPDFAALEMVEYLVGGSSNSRLWQRVREKEGLSYGVGTSLRASSLDPYTQLTAFAACAPQNGAKVEAIVRSELDGAQWKEISAAELRRVREGYLKLREQLRDNDEQLAQLLADRLNAGRTLAYDDALEKKVSALSPADLNQVARRRLDASRLVVIRAGDFASPR